MKKVDPGPGERWVDLYDALRINPTIVQALHTTSKLFKNAIGISIMAGFFFVSSICRMSKIAIIYNRSFLGEGEAWLLL